MSKIKICGLSRPQDIAFANELKPDYVGFIIEVPKSIRNVSAEKARKLREQLSSEIPAVGVFVDAPLEQIIRLCGDGILSYVQLHGREDREYVRSLKRQIEIPVIQAFSISRREDCRRAFESEADYPLLDHGRGGTGEPFDWSLLAAADRPFFLAGGLTPQNIRKAVEELHPYAVDISSGVETDGRKDYEKMKAAVAAVRRTDR